MKKAKVVKPEPIKGGMVGFSLGTKMRITTYTKDGLWDDRLVEQATELRMGPKEALGGGEKWRLEFNLACQEDVDGMINYIKQLKGDLPITKPEKKDKTTKTLDKMLSAKEPLLDLIKTVKAKAKTQEELIKTLREYNFMFVDQGTVQDVPKSDMITLRGKDVERDYQYMVRRIKEAKDPANDKFDWRLVFAIKIVGDRVDLVQIYLWGKWEEYVKIPWADKKKVNFKKVEKIYAFPEMMDYVERKKWRMENRKVIKAEETNTPFEPSKFYNKWKPYISVDGVRMSEKK